jgi:hypothetical protein
MGRSYAGPAGSAVIHAVIALFIFAAIGYVIGVVAERTVVEAVQMRFRAQWKINDTESGEGRAVETHPTGARLAA